jgi:hypothetical protein
MSPWHLSLLPFAFLAPGLRTAPADTAVTADGGGAQPALVRATQGHGIRVDGGAPVAIGPGYKAFFSPGAVTVHPALGARAPHGSPLRVELESLHRGGASLALDRSPAARAREGHRVAFDRGAGVVERWDARREGLELSFVLRELPAGDGDLVVSLGIETELRAPVGVYTEEVELVREGLGGLRVAAPVAFDSSGERVRGSLRLTDDALELVIPAAFVEAAALPLVIDPLIGPTTWIDYTSFFSDSEADADWDPVHRVWLVAWTRVFSSGDVDVLAQRMSEAGALLGAPTPLGIDPSDVDGSPCVASVASNGRFLVAWQKTVIVPPSTSSTDLLAVAIDAGTGVASPPIVVSTPGPVAPVGPRAAGDAQSLHDRALVVWGEGGDVKARSVQVPPTGAPLALVSATVDSDPLGAVTGLDVSRNGGAERRALVAWTTASLSTGGAQPWCRAVHLAGVSLGARTLLSTDPGVEEEIAVDGDGEDWAVAWDVLVGPGDRNVRLARVRWDAPPATTLVTAELQAETGPADQRGPRVAWCGPKFFLSFAEENPGPVADDYDVVVTAYEPLQLLTAEPEQRATTSLADERPSALVSAWSSTTPDEDRSLLLYSVHDQPTGDLDVWATFLETLGTGIPPVVLDPGCGGGGAITTNGPFVLGNSQFAFQLEGAPASAALAFLVIGWPQTPLTCGTCSVILQGSAFTAPVLSGSASIPMPLPFDPKFLGQSIHAQWSGVTPVPASPCVFFPGAGASSRIALTLSL